MAFFVRAGASIIVAIVLLLNSAESSRAARAVTLLAPGAGQVRALIIGINQYLGGAIPTLKGAVSDARDLELTLKNAGVSDMTVLVDPNATRRNVEVAMKNLLEASFAGDLVIISFAGHGSQQPELVKGSETDGMDEIFLLSGFSWIGAGTSERIVDDEINAWLSRLNAKGVDALFIADTCHGGGLSRQPDFRAEDLTYRVAQRPTVSLVGDELKPISTEQDARLTAGDLPNVTFLAAVDKFSKAPEVTIPGIPTKRGALSYAVARAVDRGTDGPVTRQMLFGSARQIAYQYSLTQQTIATEPSGKSANLDKPVFVLKVTGEEDYVANLPSIRIRVPPASVGLLSDVKPGLFKFRTVSDGEMADLNWDVSRGEVLNPYGDVVADCTKPDMIPAIVDRTGTVFSIAKIAEGVTQRVRLTPNDGRFRKGDIVAFQIEGLSGKYLTLVGLSGDGTVRLLFPRLKQDDPLMGADAFRLPLRVNEPFGADDVVAIVSDVRLADFEASVTEITEKRAAGDFLKLVMNTVPSQALRVGSAALFTGKR